MMRVPAALGCIIVAAHEAFRIVGKPLPVIVDNPWWSLAAAAAWLTVGAVILVRGAR